MLNKIVLCKIISKKIDILNHKIQDQSLFLVYLFYSFYLLLIVFLIPCHCLICLCAGIYSKLVVHLQIPILYLLISVCLLSNDLQQSILLSYGIKLKTTNLLVFAVKSVLYANLYWCKQLSPNLWNMIPGLHLLSVSWRFNEKRPN